MRNPWEQIPSKTWAERWEIEKQAKKACLRLHFYVTFTFVGLGVVQMVCYFKTPRSIRLVAPLNRHFKSELQWHIQNQCHIKRTICTFSCTGEKNKHCFTKRTWRYVFRILWKSSQRYVFIMRPGWIYSIKVIYVNETLPSAKTTWSGINNRLMRSKTVR